MPRLLMRHTLAAVAAVLFVSAPALAQAPVVSDASPSAAAPGSMTEVTLRGSALGGATGLWTSFPREATPKPGEDAGPAKLTLKIPGDAPVGVGAMRLLPPRGVSSVRLFMVDDLPTVAANGGNTNRSAAQALTLPAAVEGACEATSCHFYRFSARAGERVAVEVVARRLGSPLDPLVRLF